MTCRVYVFMQAHKGKCSLPVPDPTPPLVSPRSVAHYSPTASTACHTTTASPHSSTPVVSPHPLRESLLASGECFEGVGVEPGLFRDDMSTPFSENRSSISESPYSATDPEFVPDTPGMRLIGEMRGSTTPFLTSAVQIEKLMSSINETSACKAEGCNGKIVLRRVDIVAMGGDGQVHFSCSGGCNSRDLCLPSSSFYRDSNQTVFSVSLQIAFLCSGGNYAQYQTVLGTLGMQPVSEDTCYNTIKLLYNPVKTLLDEQCELGKKEMKAAPQDEIGSWKKAVTVADGAWMTRGFHSQNFTFHVRNYIRKSVLYYLHLCQRGKDNVCDEPLYQGTSKSCEGAAASVVFRQMRDEGMFVVTHWQDADSTSAREVANYFGSGKTMLCGGHYTRAHYNHLKKIKQQKSFGPGEQSVHGRTFPGVLEKKCKCVKHSKNCGCFTDSFISMSRHKFFRALVDSGTDPDLLKARLEMLPCHARDIHEWEGGKCDFHPLHVCSCGNCSSGDIQCEGKPYKTINKLNCDYHELAYEIECHSRSKQAEQAIHTALGRGHTNQLESANSALIRFRRKNWNIKRLHYHVSTNFGLLESNLTIMHSIKGTEYHWVPKLLDVLGLPNVDVVKAYYKTKNKQR